MTIEWVCCPHCGESVDLERQGSTGELKVKANEKLTVTHSRLIKCYGCGKTFKSSKPIFKEAFGGRVEYV